MMLPGLVAIWAVWKQIIYQQPPEPIELSIVGFGALVVFYDYILMKFRNYSGSLTKAAFLSARNDAVANFTIIFAGIITIFYPSIWPDILVGLFIAYIRTELSALEIYKKAHSELKNIQEPSKKFKFFLIFFNLKYYVYLYHETFVHSALHLCLYSTRVSLALKHGFNHKESVSLSEQHNHYKDSNNYDCHSSKNDKKSSNQTHCEGVCLCSHFSNKLNFISDSSNCKTNEFIITDRSILHTKVFYIIFYKKPTKKTSKKNSLNFI